MTPDIIVINADVRTCDPAKPLATALAIQGNHFVAVGSESYVRTLADPSSTRIIDAGGKTVLPGFVDSHTHMVFGADLIDGVDLFGLGTKREWLTAIAEKVQSQEPGQWLFGGRWDFASLPEGEQREWFSREEVDAVTGNVPIALRDIDFHALWLNSAAMEELGVTESSEAPEGGAFEKDARGRLTGICKETAIDWVESQDAYMEAHKIETDNLRSVMKHFNSLGVTTVHEMMTEVDTYHKLLAENELFSLRLWFGLMLISPESRRTVDFAELHSTLKPKLAQLATLHGHRFELGYIKFMVDGTLANYTAALEEEYADRCHDHFRGEPITSLDELTKLVTSANAAGFPVSIHAIGDRGIKMALSAFETSFPTSTNSLPNRMEHIEVLKREDISRFAKGRVVASMQPCHATDGTYQEARIGACRLALGYAWQTLLSSGAKLVLGSDWPTSRESPLIQLHSVIARIKYGVPWFEENALTFEEALYAYTQAPADICGWGHQIGSVTVGKCADFVVLPARLEKCEEKNLDQWRIYQTWFNGKCVYTSDGIVL